MESLECWRTCRHQFPTRCAVAGEGNDVDARISGELRTNLGTWSGDDIDDARREADLARQLGEPKCCERCGAGGLHHDGVASGQRRRRLPDRHGERIVPWRDECSNADRLAPNHGGVVAGVLTSGDPLGGAQDAGEVAQVINDGGNVAITSQLSCGARLPDLEIGKVIGLALYGVGECKEESCALSGECGAPAAGIKCAASGSDGGVHIGGRCVRNLANRGTTRWMAQGEGSPARRAT